MYIFVYVPAAGRIAPAIARNRVGPLSAQSTSIGGRVRALIAPRCLFPQRYPCNPGTCVGEDRTVSGVGSLAMAFTCHRSWALDVGIQRTRRLGREPHICRDINKFMFVLLKCTFLCMYCRRPYRSRHRSESSGTSFSAVN